MLRLRIAGALTLLISTPPASAQFPIGPPPPVPPPGGLWFGFQGKRLSVAGALGGYGAYGGGGPVPWYAPPFGFGPPPISVVVRPPRIVVPPLPAPSLAAEPAAGPRPIDPARFTVIKPAKGNDVAPVKPVAPANPPARVEKKQQPFDLGIVPAEFPLAPRPEAEELLNQGKFAFARAEYGVALE